MSNKLKIYMLFTLLLLLFSARSEAGIYNSKISDKPNQKVEQSNFNKSPEGLLGDAFTPPIEDPDGPGIGEEAPISNGYEVIIFLAFLYSCFITRRKIWVNLLKCLH